MGNENGKDDAQELVLPMESARAFREAGERALNAGREIVYVEDGVVYRRDPATGACIMVGRVEPPQSIARGWKTTLR